MATRRAASPDITEDAGLLSADEISQREHNKDPTLEIHLEGPVLLEKKTEEEALVQNRIVRALYGDISAVEFRKFFLLASIFFFIIGGYWLLRPLKDAVFFTVVGGKLYLPYAKMLSVFVVILVVMLYAKLVDQFSKVALFNVVTSFFAVVLIGCGLLLWHPTIGLSNTNADPSRWFGWFVYFSVECYGSLLVSMFWSFVSSITESKSARRGYSIVVGGAQVGAICGPFMAVNAKTFGVPALFVLAGLSTGGIVLMMGYFVRTLPPSQLRGATIHHSQLTGANNELKTTPPGKSATDTDHSDAEGGGGGGGGGGKAAGAAAKDKSKAGFFEGLRIIATRPYVLGIMLVSTLYEVISTIVDYQLKVMAHATPAYSDAEGLTHFLGMFGMTTNFLALVMALLGTSYLMRRFGLRFCLLAYPVSVLITSVSMYLLSDLPIEKLLWITFAVMVLTKGLSYALNNPAKEIMYIPTSDTVKYKAKSWVDLFGGRSAKAAGSMVTSQLKTIASTSGMMRTGAVVSILIVGVWTIAAHKVGKTYERMTSRDEIVK